MNNYYNTLEIPVGSSKEVIKKAFRRLAHIWHPDKKGGDEEKFKLINVAYSELMKLPDGGGINVSHDVFSQFTKQQNRRYDGMIRQNMIKNLEMRIANAKTRRSILDIEIASLEQELSLIKDSE